jgi:hypothetical protein
MTWLLKKVEREAVSCVATQPRHNQEDDVMIVQRDCDSPQSETLRLASGCARRGAAGEARGRSGKARLKARRMADTAEEQWVRDGNEETASGNSCNKK